MAEASASLSASETPAAPETPVVPETPAPDAPPDPAVAEEQELSTIEAELVKSTPTLKGSMNVSRHQAVLTRARKAHEAELAKIKESYAKYEDPAFTERVRVAEIAEREPERFLEFVLGLDHYKPHVDKMIEAALAKRQPAPAPVETTAPAAVEIPEPDELLPSGAMGYSQASALKMAEAIVARELGPVLKELKGLKEGVDPIFKQRESDARLEQSRQALSKALAEAREKWDGFKDNEAEIQKIYNANPDFNLRTAYYAWQAAANKADASKIEESLKAKLKADLAKPAVPDRPAPGGAPPPGPVVEGDAEDRVREAIRQSARGLK